MKNYDALRVHQLLVGAPGLRPVALGEGRRFARWELGALAEPALGEAVEPEGLTAASERGLRQRLGSAGREYQHCDERSRRYWLTDRSEIVGTIAVDSWPRGWQRLGVSSLYVHPRARRAGRALRALTTVYEAASAAGFNGIRLDTHWSWQEAVRFYLARGMWVGNWKHALTLEWGPDRPRYEVRRREEEFAFRLEYGGVCAPVFVARRDGGRLVLRRTRWHRRIEREQGRPGEVLLFHGLATFALHLAVAGWPLVRGAEEWERAPESCDIGAPEGLAYKIRRFERVARAEGWRVETPSPVVDAGLPTPSWIGDG
ncbi:GNAT family N-acetyltransferase [Streptomyces sp. NPDC101227]|uniref:GNAT family N-acetyltransferase n=1 Tax=Streptomyces sp. NPDC101227 TaxID=3366136 RepID=UPI00380AC15A